VWIEGTGIPPDAMEPDSATYRKICTLAAEFKSGKIPSEDEVADWSGQEWELYLENLSKDVEASQVCIISLNNNAVFYYFFQFELYVFVYMHLSFRQLTYIASLFIYFIKSL
jgi:hypothetical protein